MKNRHVLLFLITIFMVGTFCSRGRLAFVSDIEEKYNAGDISGLMNRFAEGAFLEIKDVIIAKEKRDIQNAVEFLHTLDSHIHFSGMHVGNEDIVGEMAESNAWLVKSGLGKGCFNIRLGWDGKRIDSIQMEMTQETLHEYNRVLGEFMIWALSTRRDGFHERTPAAHDITLLKDFQNWPAIFQEWLDSKVQVNEMGKDFASVMDVIGVREGMIIADVGAGDGTYSFQLSKKVGKTGKIYSTDIKKKWLVKIKERSTREGISNVFTVLGGETDARLPEEEFDLIFLRHTLHCMSDPERWLENLKPYIRPDTSLVIIDGDPDILGYGWEYENKKEKVIHIAEKAGFKLERLETFMLPEDYLFVFRLKGSSQL